MAGALGVEPSRTGSEPVALPSMLCPKKKLGAVCSSFLPPFGDRERREVALFPCSSESVRWNSRTRACGWNVWSGELDLNQHWLASEARFLR